jgi:hypothetical protein
MSGAAGLMSGGAGGAAGAVGMGQMASGIGSGIQAGMTIAGAVRNFREANVARNVAKRQVKEEQRQARRKIQKASADNLARNTGNATAIASGENDINSNMDYLFDQMETELDQFNIASRDAAEVGAISAGLTAQSQLTFGIIDLNEGIMNRQRAVGQAPTGLSGMFGEG